MMFLICAGVATWAVCTPVFSYPGNPRAGHASAASSSGPCMGMASDILNSALGSSLP